MFKNKDVPENWLSNLNRKFTIQSLEIIDTNIANFQDDAFKASGFKNTISVTFDSLSTTNLRPKTFEHLNKVETLRLLNLPLDVAYNNVLHPFASTLKHLSIENSVKHENPFVFNFFNELEFPSLETLSLARNNLSDLGLGQIFDNNRMSRRLHSINFNECLINDLDKETFVNVHQLRQISLQGNFLEYLPDGIFDNVLRSSNAEIQLANNPWNCDCELVHLRDLILSNRQQFPGPVLCFTPWQFNNTDMIGADLCPVDSKEIEE